MTGFHPARMRPRWRRGARIKAERQVTPK
jgi:hypothetical protein